MKIMIRADASGAIGSGHVVRCLSLADELAARGASVHFVCRDLPDHLRQLVASRGHALTHLRGAASQAPDQRLPEEPWPVASQRADALETLAALAPAGSFDWLIVDHYALGTEWELAMAPLGVRRLAIDDLGRTHACELLLDQNLYPDGAARYDGCVDATCRRLVGPEFALLRPEFRTARETARIRDGAVSRILVFLGGMDAANVTMTALRALAALDAPLPAIDVVIGLSHPARSEVEALCGRLGAACHVQTAAMALLCANADLAIGAGGSATWERCATGLPALVLAVADNQREIARNGARAGLLHFPDVDPADDRALGVHLRALMEDAALRSAISRKALAAVDGRGCERVAHEMENP